MPKLSDNYYSREYFFKTKQVPTQSLIMQKMGERLANVYFKSMSYNHRVLAGLEPSLKGGGSDWYVPPMELLKGNVALKPEAKKHLALLGSKGIIQLGEQTINRYRQNKEKEKQQGLTNIDDNWKETIKGACQQHWEDGSKMAKERNRNAIQKAFHEYTTMFTTSITNIESLLLQSSMNEVKRMKQEATSKMEFVLKERIKIQANRLYKQYTERLNTEKEKRKQEFLKKIEMLHKQTATKLHDLRLEKHVIVENIKYYLQAQNLACRVYVALKEKEECEKELAHSEHEHKKKIKRLKNLLETQKFEISLAQEKEKIHKEFNTIWKKKVCEVVKKLQMFITYCLSSVPEYADFFIDMEKLMLLHLNEVFDNSQAESIFEDDNAEKFHTPIPKPHPFYLVCDQGNKPKFKDDLCPKHCTSSASQMPVVLVNKRCIYAACDNFQQFTNKITDFVHGRRGDDIDFEDNHDYERDIPIKYTAREELKELKLESSLFQILQKEWPNLFNLDLNCCNNPVDVPTTSKKQNKSARASTQGNTKSVMSEKNSSEESFYSDNKLTREGELKHEREPKIKGYLDYIKPMACKCAKTAKKHLVENLPSYMTAMSKYEEEELSNYEKCPVDILKMLVKKGQGRPPQLPPSPKTTSLRCNKSTQYIDQQFDMLCTCFSADPIEALIKGLTKDTADEPKKTLDADISATILNRHTSSFIKECANEMKNVVKHSPDLQEIFIKKDCNYHDKR